jgi:hypothetical protein
MVEPLTKQFADACKQRRDLNEDINEINENIERIKNKLEHKIMAETLIAEGRGAEL